MSEAWRTGTRPCKEYDAHVGCQLRDINLSQKRNACVQLHVQVLVVALLVVLGGRRIWQRDQVGFNILQAKCVAEEANNPSPISHLQWWLGRVPQIGT